jgi:outer membrane protein TolC
MDLHLDLLKRTALFFIACNVLNLHGHPLMSFSVEEYGGKLSVDDCVAIALRHNPSHQKVKGEMEVSSANLLSSYGQLLPTVNFGYGVSEDHYFNPTFLNPEGSVSSFPITIPAGTQITHQLNDSTGEVEHVVNSEDIILPIPQGTRRSSSGQIQISETLFQGGRNIFNIMKARAEKEISRQDVNTSELDLVYQIHQQYFQVLADKRRVDLAREVLEQRKEQLRLAKARKEVGSVTKLDVMQAEIDKGTQENTLTTEENNLKVAKMELNRLMGIPLDVEYEMSEEFETFEPNFNERDLIEGAMRKRPDLQAILAQEKAGKKEVWAQRANYLPGLSFDLFLFRSEQGSGADPFTISPENHDSRYSLNLDWEFFSGFSRHSSGKAAEVDLENTRHDILAKKLQVEKDVKEALMNLTSVYQQSLITDKNRHLASENLRLEQERYRLGSASLLDLRTAQVTYIQAETEHINKVLEFNTSFASLEKATGLRLKD